jgi:hypothetical protein
MHMNSQFKLVISQMQAQIILKLKSMMLFVHTNMQLKLEGDEFFWRKMEIRMMHP